MQPVILSERLSCRFDETVAVDELSIEVNAGEIFGFLGHNGAGKTTTVRLLNGLLAPWGGSASVLGYDPVRQGPQLRLRTGVLTETPSLDERLTGYQNLAVYGELFDVARGEVDGRIVELLEVFGLSERSQEKAGTYSGGMKQRLALARAMLHRPEILFLDEPASGLDPVATRQLHALIVHLSRQERCTVFLCTHNLAEAQELCDRVAVLQQGRLLALGTPRDLAQQVIQGRHLQIETDADHVNEAQRVIWALPQLGESSHDGKMINVTNVDHAFIPSITEALVTAGIPIYQIRVQEPTLEDVYFALHEQETVRR